MQGKQLLMPTILLLMAVIVGTGSGVYTMYKGIRPAEDQSALPRNRSATEMVLAQEEIFPGTSIQSLDMNHGMQTFVDVHNART